MATVLGLIAFVILGNARGGVAKPVGTPWLISGITVAVLTAGMGWVGWTRHGRVAAALLGTASGVCFGFEAAVTKLLVAEIGGGVLALFTDWPLYVFAITGAVGFALQQASLKTGSLAPALAGIHCATLTVSVVIGITVFREALSHGTGRLIPAWGGLAVAFAGVVLLSLYEASARGIGPERERQAIRSR